MKNLINNAFLTLRISQKLLKQVDKIAIHKKISRSKIIRKALKLYVKKCKYKEELKKQEDTQSQDITPPGKNPYHFGRTSK